MSLISQVDREMAIEAFEHYISHLREDNRDQASINSFITLRNWVQLEYNKNRSHSPSPT